MTRKADSVLDRRSVPWLPFPALQRLVLQSWITHPALIGIVAFSGYWVGPGLVAAWDGHFLPEGPWETWTLFGDSEGVPEAYLTDRTHALFALIVTAGAAVGASVVRGFSDSLSALQDALAPAPPRSAPAAIAGAWLRHAWIPGLLIAVLASVSFLVVFSDTQYDAWWGHQSRGMAGVAFSGAVLCMVLASIQGIACLSGFAWHVSRQCRHATRFRLFHGDRCNGLAKLGATVSKLWVIACLIAAAVFLTLSVGYLGIETQPLTWLLAVLVSGSLPVMAIAPVWACARALNDHRSARLASLEPFIEITLGELAGCSPNQDDDHWTTLSARLDGLLNVRSAIAEANVFPFNPKAVSLLVLVYVFQVSGVLFEIVGLMGR